MLGSLADIGKRVIEGSGETIAPTPERVARAWPDGAEAGLRGRDQHFHVGQNTFHIWASDARGVATEVERAMMELLARSESTQRGSLSNWVEAISIDVRRHRLGWSKWTRWSPCTAAGRGASG